MTTSPDLPVALQLLYDVADGARGRVAILSQPASGDEEQAGDGEGLVGVQAAPDLPGTDSGAARGQRLQGRLRRRSGAHRAPRGGEGVARILVADGRSGGGRGVNSRPGHALGIFDGHIALEGHAEAQQRALCHVRKLRRLHP